MEKVAEQNVALGDFTADLFMPLIGQKLIFERPADAEVSTTEPARLELLEVKPGKKSPALRREPFSLLFVLKDQEQLGNGLHRLRQPGFEAAELLISRVTAPKYEAQDPAGMFYEAVFG